MPMKKTRDAAYPEIHQRLRIFMRTKGLGNEELGRDLDITAPSVANFGRRNLMAAEKLMALGKAHDLSLSWLLLGRGPMFLGADAPRAASASTEPGRASFELLDRMESLWLATGARDVHRSGEIIPPEPLAPTEGEFLAFRVEDDDMAPALRKGWLAGGAFGAIRKGEVDGLHNQLVVVRAEGANGSRTTVRRLGALSSEIILEATDPRMSPAEARASFPLHSPPEICGRLLWWVGRQ